VVVARATVATECGAVESWFDGFAASLGAPGHVVATIPPVDAHLAPEVVGAWDAVRRDGRRDGVIAVLRLLWVEERMADLRGLQADLATTTERAERPPWWRRVRGTREAASAGPPAGGPDSGVGRSDDRRHGP